MPYRTVIAAALGALFLTGPVYADGHLNGAVTARKSHMQLYQHNLGILGAMVRGNAEYDGAAAAAAASNLAALAQLSQGSYWPPGSDNTALPGQTRALPAIWENIPDVIAITGRLAAAASALAETAEDGLPAVQAGLGAIGQTCGACHDDYRAARN